MKIVVIGGTGLIGSKVVSKLTQLGHEAWRRCPIQGSTPSLARKKFDVPTLVLHGEDDQIVPVKDSAVKSARLIKGAKDVYYPGAPHGITATHQDQVNAELLTFIKA